VNQRPTSSKVTEVAMRAVVFLVPGWLAVMSIAAHADPSLGLEPIDSLDLPFDHGEIRLTARASGPDTFDGGGSYRDGSIALAGAIPLYTSAHLRGWRVLAQLRLEGERVPSTLLPRDESIAESALGVTALYVSERHDLYGLYAGAAIAESTATLSNPTLMPTALGLGSYRSGALTWLYGGGLGYALGRPWLLPVAGVVWRASPTWIVSTLLPVTAQVRHEVTAALALSLVVSISGNRYQIANDDAFPGAANTLTVELAQLRTGVTARYKLGRWILRAELGVFAPRWLRLTDGNALDMSSSSYGTVYLSTGVGYAFD
jgi:hypothetical protein